MPILKTRFNHTKVYRPNGSRFATAVQPTVDRALQRVFSQFELEFGALPRRGETVVEIVGGDLSGWTATLFEVKE